jgi:hypothetical protein
MRTRLTFRAAAAAALALLAQAACTERALPPRASAHTAPLDEGRSEDLAADMRRFALNALLVPVLDDEANPARWGDPSLAMPCQAGTRVLVDGVALQPRAESSGRAFTLEWTLDQCLPFGSGGPEFSGVAELVVFRDDDGVSAIVRMIELQVRRDEVSVVMNTSFVARTP